MEEEGSLRVCVYMQVHVMTSDLGGYRSDLRGWVVLGFEKIVKTFVLSSGPING